MMAAAGAHLYGAPYGVATPSGKLGVKAECYQEKQEA